MLRIGLKEGDRSFAVCGCGVAAYDLDEEDGQRPQIPVHHNDTGRAWVCGIAKQMNVLIQIVFRSHSQTGGRGCAYGSG